MLISKLVLLLILPAVWCSDFTYYIKEEKSPGTLVGDIAVDAHLKGYPSPGTHSNVQFKLKEESPTNGTEFFTLSPINKKLYTEKLVDADSLCAHNKECYLIIIMEILQNGSLIHTLSIKVIIEDVNDNKPEFPENQINLEFSENDSIGTQRLIPYAVDRDVSIPNSRIKYELLNSEAPFALSAVYLGDRKSELNISLKGKLDRETKPSYKVQIIAKDQGNPSQQSALDVHITITDGNDNFPEFSQRIYNVTISYNVNKNVPIVLVKATDLDEGKSGKITYRISSQTSKTAKALFRINRETGEIFLQKELDLNQRALYTLFVKATYGGRSRLTVLSIVNVSVLGSKNNAPKIEVNFISGSTEKRAVISEGTEIGSFIAYVKVMDDDPGENGEVICDLRHSHFQLQNMGIKKYKVTVRNLLDREAQSLHDITIVCQDKGSPPLQSEQKLSIHISDVNDVRPTFSQKTYTFQIYENQKTRIPIGLINVTDPDLRQGGKVTYSLLKNPKTFLPFRIANGAVITTTRSLDRESKDAYRFKVLARDNGVPSLNNTATVFIKVLDENDNVPHFTFPDTNPFHLDVSYPAHQRNITTLRAVDMDINENSQLNFKIIKGNYQSLFTLDRHSGQLFFSRTPSINDSRTYKLLLLVKDSGTPSLSSTTNLTLALAVENAGTLTAVRISKDFSLAKDAQMVTALLATVGSLSVAILILILVLKMHHLKALCCNRSSVQSMENDENEKNSEGPTKKTSSWMDISLDMKMNPYISEETLPRKSEDETETDDKKDIFTSDENLHTSEYDDTMTSYDGSDEEVRSSGKFKKMRQVSNPSYYTSQCLTLSRTEQPQYADIDSLPRANRYPEDIVDIPQEHKAMVHDDLYQPDDISLRYQKQDSHSKKMRQIPAYKQQSKIPKLPQMRYAVLENRPNPAKQSTQTPKQELNMARSMSEDSNSTISQQSSLSDDPGLAPTRKTIGSVKPKEKPSLVKGRSKCQQELPPYRDRKLKDQDSEVSVLSQYSAKYAPTSERPTAESQSQILSPRRSPSQIPVPRFVSENTSHPSTAKTLHPDVHRLGDTQDNIRLPKSTTKSFESKIPTPFTRTQASSKLTPITPESTTSDQSGQSCFPAPYQGQCMDEMVTQRPKRDHHSKRSQHQPDLISQESKAHSYSQMKQPSNYPDWLTQHQKSTKARDPQYPKTENLNMSTSFTNTDDGQYSHGIGGLLNSLKPAEV